jgi:hypothetical protein
MPNLDHSLFNPNQLRHFGAVVQDNPYDAAPMCVKSADNTFTACLDSVGADIFLKTWAPSDADLRMCPHVVLSSSAQWSPKLVQFPGTSHLEQEEIESRNVCGVQTMEECICDRRIGHEMKEDLTFSIDELCNRIISSIRVTHRDLEAREISKLRFKELPPPVLPGPIEERDIKAPCTFLSDDCHSNTTPVDLSERWGLSVAQAALTLKATTRHLLRSALMPLARRYRADRMFQVPRLEGTWATDAMYMRCNSAHGERHCQIHANKMFFAEACPMPKKSDCHETLDNFVNDYGAMDLLISDGSAEQCGLHTEFQRKIQKYQIQHKRSEKDRPNQNPAEGVIREVRKKWHRTMFKTNCPKRLWTCGVPCVCAIMRMTASHAGRSQGRTPIEAVLGETPDVSKHLGFGFMIGFGLNETPAYEKLKSGNGSACPKVLAH